MASNFNEISRENHMERENISENLVSQTLEAGEILANPIPDATPEKIEEPQHEAQSSGSSVTRKFPASFKLFQHKGDQGYVLEMHELDTGAKNAHLLTLRQSAKIWEIETKKTSLHQHNVLPMENIANPPFQPKYALSLQDRLVGWLVQERKRTGSSIVDKYYKHERVPRTFCSLKEVAPFILYSCRKEDIQLAKEIYEKHETVKAFLGEAYSNFYKYHAEDDEESSDAAIPHTNSANKPDHDETDLIEGTPSKLDNAESNDDEVFSFALNNPIE